MGAALLSWDDRALEAGSGRPKTAGLTAEGASLCALLLIGIQQSVDLRPRMLLPAYWTLDRVELDRVEQKNCRIHGEPGVDQFPRSRTFDVRCLRCSRCLQR